MFGHDAFKSNTGCDFGLHACMHCIRSSLSVNTEEEEEGFYKLKGRVSRNCNGASYYGSVKFEQRQTQTASVGL